MTEAPAIPQTYLQFIGKKIFSDIPVYEINFSDESKYQGFCQALQENLNGIDFSNKIIFSDSQNKVLIYYYPRIFKSLFSLEQIQNFLPFLDCKEGGFIHNPYQILNPYLTASYIEFNQKSFERAAALFDAEIAKRTDLSFEPSASDYAIQISDEIPSEIFGNFKQKYLGIGEKHIDTAAKNLVSFNLSFFEEQGFDIIFLEGIPHEAQQMIDDYLKSADPSMPLELSKILSGSGNAETNTVKLIKLIKEKRLKLRIIALDSYATYLADDSHLYKPALRIKAFNYIALKIIENTQSEGKQLFFVGGDHLKKGSEPGCTEIPGLSMFLDCPAITIFDNYGERDNIYCTVPGVFFSSKAIYYTWRDIMWDHKEEYHFYSTIDRIVCDYALITAPNSTMILGNIRTKDDFFSLVTTEDEASSSVANVTSTTTPSLGTQMPLTFFGGTEKQKLEKTPLIDTQKDNESSCCSCVIF